MVLTPKALLGGILQTLLFPLTLFLAAGTAIWPAGWIFLLLLTVFIVATVRLLARKNPDLLEERMAIFRSEQKRRDTWFLFLLVVSSIWLAFMPLDAVRFHWSQVPVWLQGGGALILASAFALIYWTFRVNAYLTPTVRIQSERGHTVVTSGPYQHMRHPMYTGFSLFFIGTALLLGSALGLMFSLILIGLFARRAVLEEHVLQQELPGYTTYMTRVRYRFMPYIW